MHISLSIQPPLVARLKILAAKKSLDGGQLVTLSGLVREILQQALDREKEDHGWQDIRSNFEGKEGDGDYEF